MNCRSRAKILLEKQAELFLDAATDSDHDMRRRMVVDLRHQRIVTHFISVARGDVKVCRPGKINPPQPVDRFSMGGFGGNNPEHAFVRPGTESHD